MIKEACNNNNVALQMPLLCYHKLSLNRMFLHNVKSGIFSLYFYSFVFLRFLGKHWLIDIISSILPFDRFFCRICSTYAHICCTFSFTMGDFPINGHTYAIQLRNSAVLPALLHMIRFALAKRMLNRFMFFFIPL